MATTECQRPAVVEPRLVPAPPVEAPVQTLRDIIRRYGTPTYAYDLESLRSQAAKLRANLPAEVGVYYSLKSNASLGLCGFLAGCGVGADIASAGELATALAAGFPPERVYVSGPDKSPAMREQLRSAPGAILSIDSVSELKLLSDLPTRHRALLRLRPDFSSFAACAAGPNSRFGLVPADLAACRPYLASSGIEVIGFHVFAGSQVLIADHVVQHLHGAFEQAMRTADILGITPQMLNLGGGFGIPYGPDQSEMDLAPIDAELRSLIARAGGARIVLELGRYLVAKSGWYLTSVIAHQTHQGRQAVVVDGGSHQRGDLCGLDLRHRAHAPVVLGERRGPVQPTDVLGCLSLPGDVLAESSWLPPLSLGDLLAFPNAGAYGLLASPMAFHGHPAPAEVAFEGTSIDAIRERQPITSLLAGQRRLP